MNFKTKKTILKIYLFLSVIATIAFSVWRILLLKEYCNPYDMSFQDGALPALKAFEYALLAVCALLSSCIFFAKKIKFGHFGARISTTSVSICAISGFALAAVGILSLIYYADIIFDFSDDALLLYRIFQIATLALMFLTALYFLGRASVSLKNSPSIATLSLLFPCFCIAYLACSYFNSELPLLDFNRVTSQISFIAVLMFALSEARLATDQGSYPFRFAASIVCVVCASAYIIPLLALVAFWEIGMSLTLMMEISLACILIYAVFAAFNAVRTMKES